MAKRCLIGIILLGVLLLTPPAVVRAKTDVWSRLGLIGDHVTAIAIGDPGAIYVATAAGGLLRIENGRQVILTQGLGTRSNPATAIAVDPLTRSTVYAATAEGIFSSLDAGLNWTLLTPDVPGAVALAIHPQDSSVIYAAAGVLGLFKTVDAGVNWERSTLGSSVQNIALDPQSPSTVYAATSIGVVKSTDGGSSWVSHPWTAGEVRGLAVDPLMPNTLYAGSAAGGVWKSDDGGVTWYEAGLRATSAFTIVVDIQDNSTVYAATETGPYKSVDGGQNWLLIHDGINAKTTSMAGDLALCKVYVGTENGAFETDIGPVLTIHSSLFEGANWTVVVSHAGGNAPILLTGISNGVAWEVPNWGTTNGGGMFTAAGTFPASAQGSHQLQIEVGGVLSNILSFTVTNCGQRPFMHP